MNILKENSLAVLKVVYDESKYKNTLRTNLSFNEILKKVTISNLTIKDIKYAVEYLNDSRYFTYSDHILYNDICITALGIDYYYENFD